MYIAVVVTNKLKNFTTILVTDICKIISQQEEISSGFIKVAAAAALFLLRGVVDASLHIGMEPNVRNFWTNLKKRKLKMRSIHAAKRTNELQTVSTSV